MNENTGQFTATYELGKVIGAAAERERIIAQLEQYATDLRECGKEDNCLEIALAVEGQIEDIKGEQQ